MGWYPVQVHGIKTGRKLDVMKDRSVCRQSADKINLHSYKVHSNWYTVYWTAPRSYSITKLCFIFLATGFSFRIAGCHVGICSNTVII